MIIDFGLAEIDMEYLKNLEEKVKKLKEEKETTKTQEYQKK